MDQLTLTLHKTKDTKNKVVYGTKDGAVIQSVYIDKDALGDVPTRRNGDTSGPGSTPCTSTFMGSPAKTLITSSAPSPSSNERMRKSSRPTGPEISYWDT